MNNNNTTTPKKLSQLANCIRFLSIDAVQKANSGHPGMPMGMADIATVLFKNHLKTFPDLKIDYISIACTKTLDEVEGAINTAVLISAAVFLRDVRLIDNFTYFPST